VVAVMEKESKIGIESVHEIFLEKRERYLEDLTLYILILKI